MARIFKCDICGKEVKGEEFLASLSHYVGSNFFIEDACDDCHVAFRVKKVEIEIACKGIKHAWLRRLLRKMKEGKEDELARDREEIIVCRCPNIGDSTDGSTGWNGGHGCCESV